MGWKTFNDRLALFIMLLIFAFWAALGLGKITVPGEIVGASIMGWTLVLQFYFRKSAPSNGEQTPTP